MALRDLLFAMHKANESLQFYNEEGDHQVLVDDNLQFTGAQFDRHFLVQPHLGRNGGGRIHVHFRVSHNFSLSNISQQRSLLHYLQDRRIWLALHQFSAKTIATVGFIMLKSPSMTHQEDYIKNLKNHLLRHATSRQHDKDSEPSATKDDTTSSKQQ